MKKQTVTIEKTSKRYKGATVIGLCLSISGLIIMYNGIPVIGSLAVIGGFGICVYARIGAWWNNG